MRILQLGRFWNDQHGGIERHVALLSRELAEHGADVVNLVASADRDASDVRYDGYRLVQSASFGVVAGTAISPALVWRALALHREQPFDVVHLHLPDPLSHLVSMLLPRKVKRVLTWHSDIVRQKNLLALYAPWLRALTRRADAIVAATQSHFDGSEQISTRLPREKMHVIPYGVDPAPFALTPATASRAQVLRGRGGGKFMVFAFGRHVYYKGFDVLLQAMRSMDAFLVLGGDGPLRPSLQAQAQQIGIEHKVLFAGRIPEEDLAAHFHACDAFCMPSVERSEAFGLVQVEAMVCGKPVVNTWLGNGVNEVCVHEESGLTVAPRDPVALAAALVRLAADPELRASLGARGRERALSAYSLKGMTDRHLALYTSLLATRR